MADAWYYAQNGHQLGPVGAEQLKAMLRVGQVGADELVWTDGMPDWQPAREVAALQPPADVPPLTGQADNAAPPLPPSPSPAAHASPPAPGTTAGPMGYYGATPTPARPQTSAIVSLCCGIGSFLLCGIPYLNFLTWAAAICAIVFGFKARARIARGEEEGQGLAVAGMVLGFAHLLLFALAAIVLVIFGIAIARSGGNPGAAGATW
jgi:type IV pilus assembly protein PilA